MYENVIEKINEQKWNEAAHELSKILAKDIFDEHIAVLTATVFAATGNIVKAREVITKGLQLNYKNYELWLILGETYENTNINQAYLCYENALYFCNNTVDAGTIDAFLENVKINENFCVKKCAIVVLSYNSLPFTKECLQSIRTTCPESAYEIIVVDNASTDGSVEWLREQKDIILQCNKENVGFPAGCNQGIKLAQTDSDVFLLNNDTLLPPNAVFWLRMGLYENENIGAVGAVSNYVSNFQKVDWNCKTKEEFLNAAISNNLPLKRPYERRNYLVGYAMMIRRGALEEVGYLDEIFSPGTYEDNDIGFRLCEKGYEILLCRNSFIYHYGSGGGANLQKWKRLYARNVVKIADKWGFDPTEYLVVNNVVNGIEADEQAPLKILDVGCGIGLTLLLLEYRFPNAELYGIENNKNLWELIPKGLNICHCGPETGTLPYSKGYFDIISLGAVYDRSLNQVALVEKYADYLNESGLLFFQRQTLKKSDIIFNNRYLKKVPSIAMCIFTHNHPNTVRNVLEEICPNYYLHGVDVYFYDSSEGEETEKNVEPWKNKGYTNLYYVNRKGLSLEDKMAAVSRGEGLERQYDYIWPCKDRTIWSKETLDAIREHLTEYPDIMYLEVRGNETNPEKNMYEDGLTLYRDHSLGLTSLDTTIYKYDSVWADTEGLCEAFHAAEAFPHFYFTLKKLMEMEAPKLCILQGKRIVLYDVRQESGWIKNAFYVWKDCWIRMNENLPACYMPYRERVIKYVASQPWLIGGIERLQELKDIGALTVEKLDEIEVNWERVSDIPFEIVRKIAEA